MNPEKPAGWTHNVRWVEFVFGSRAVTEELLSPEREAGNLNEHDYHLAVDFFSSVRGLKYRPILAALVFGGTAVAGLRLRKPKWPQWQNAGIICVMTVTGFGLGQFQRLSAHAKYLKAIQNPVGYAQAIKNIETRIGMANRDTDGPSITLTRKPKDNSNSAPDDTESSEMIPTILLPGSASMSEAPTPQTQKALTKWDEIRKANNNSAHLSSWDALRQKHEKESVSSNRTAQKMQPKPRDSHSPGAVIMVDSASESREAVDIDRYAVSGDKYSRST